MPDPRRKEARDHVDTRLLPAPRTQIHARAAWRRRDFLRKVRLQRPRPAPAFSKTAIRYGPAHFLRLAPSASTRPSGSDVRGGMSRENPSRAVRPPDASPSPARLGVEADLRPVEPQVRKERMRARQRRVPAQRHFQRRRKPAQVPHALPVATMKAVSARLFSAAIACIASADGKASIGITAAGPPAIGRSANASIWKKCSRSWRPASFRGGGKPSIAARGVQSDNP